MKNRKKTVLRILLIPVLAALALLLVYTVYSFAHTSRALHTLEEYQALYPDIMIREDESGTLSLLPPAEEENGIGIVFYAGASVEPLAYVPLLARVAQQGYAVYAPQFPWGMATFDAEAADTVIAQHPEIEGWYLAGHSMGGRFAADYAAAHSDALQGVIVISGTPSEALAATELPLLLLYGDLDGIYKGVQEDDILPADTAVCCLAGANHAQFGDYGKQLMDHDAGLSPEDQWEQAAARILAWLQE